MDWKPIESAPKDGTHLLLYYRFASERRISEGRWSQHGNCWVTFDDPMVRATHWMPLPPPPQDTP